MADEINVGKLVAEIILESKTDGADEAIDKIKEVNTAAKDGKITLDVDVQNQEDLIYIREVLEKIGIKGTEADNILSSAFADTSGLRKYKDNIEELSKKLDEQRKKVEDLRSWSSKSSLPDIGLKNETLEKEIETLNRLEDEFDQAYAAQDDWVVKQVKNFQKQEAATDSAAAKQEKLNQKMSDQKSKNNISVAVRTLTSSLRTADTVLPDAIDNIDTLVTNIIAVKDAIQSAGKASMALTIGSGIIAVAGIAISLITNYIQQIQKKEEEARKKALQTLNEFKDSDDNLSDTTSRYTEIKYKLDNLNLSRTEEISLKSELLDMQKQLNDEYGEEAKNIDLINGNVTEQIENLKRLRLEKAKETEIETYSDYEKAKEKLKEERNITLNFESSMSEYNSSLNSGIRNKMNETGFEFNPFNAGKLNYATGNYDFVISASLETGELKKQLMKLANYIDEQLSSNTLTEEQAKMAESLRKSISANLANLPDEIKDWEDTVKKYNNAQEVIKNEGASAEDVTNVYNALFNAINENISAFGALQDAYMQLSSGQSLSADTLSELTEKYPQLQKYIAETGDLSLQNGEYLKRVAQDTMESNLDRIDGEKEALEAKGKMTEEEKGYYEELQAKAVIYQSQLDELNSKNLGELTSSLSSLGSAWSQLSQGKSLDFDTTLSLINQYPQLAQAMANGSLSIENQADVIKKLWEIKKQEAISSLELEKQKQLESGKTTQKIVGDIQKQITAYETEIQLRITMGAKESEYATTLQLVNDLKKQQGDLLQADKDKVAAIDAQIAAIKGLTIETYNSASATSDKNEALAEELKYMEHLKALGQLTAEDELAWLQRINATYAQNTDERYDMEKRLYNAEKAWREEQEKAISDALQNEYKWIGYNKSLDSLSKQQELDWLLRIRDQYALNAEQAIELQIKIYEAEKALREEKIQAEYTAMNNQKSLDRLTSEQELEWLERIRATFELNAEQRMELEIKIHNLKKQLADEEKSTLEKAYDEALDRLERRKKVTALSYDLEIAYLDEIRRKYKLTAEDAADLEQRIRDLLKDKKEADISALDKLGDAVTEALKNKYEQQRELEEDLINQSIENWKKWEDETTAAIQGQIDALDKLDEAQESEDKRREYELKRQQVELKLAYEKDDYNRKQLQKELNRLDKEEAERLLKEERKAQKEALQQQLEDVKKQSQEQQDALQKELDAIGENYDKLTSSFNLRAETEKAMLQSSQKQLIEMIKSYAPEYDLAGQSIGESLYNGFYGKYKSIETMVQQISNFQRSYQRDLARTANAAADNFWASRAEYEVQLNAKASQSAQPAKQDISMTVIFNEPVDSPIQVRRQLETVVDNLAAEIRK